MILVTRLNGPQFAVNPDLLQRIESAPDTVLTLFDGTKYIVEESTAEIIELIRDDRARVIARVQQLQSEPVALAAAGAVADGRGDSHDAPLAPMVQLRPRGR